MPSRVVKSPDGREVLKRGRRVALFTNGAQTVILSGPRRSFKDGPVTVEHDVWVRLTPTGYAGDHDEKWLTSALRANEDGKPDVLAIAMQYLEGADAIRANGLVIAGSANYGPEGADGIPEEGADFNDFLGIKWGSDQPEPDQIGCLDCSGYVRMIFGYRTHTPNAARVVALSSAIGPQQLPRRAYQMFAGAPGVLVTVRAGGQPPDVAKLKPGDLMFFKADAKDANEADHVGIFLGADADGGLRFVSSRKTANGPMFTDVGGASVLTGQGLYARSFVGARRI